MFKAGLSFTLTVDGETVTTDLAETDSTFELANRAVFKLGTIPNDGAVIQYAIYESSAKAFSQITTDSFTGNGVNKEFTLSQTPFTSEPTSQNIIVRVGNKFLDAGINQQFKIASTREYQLRQWQVSTATISAENVRVFLMELNKLLTQLGVGIHLTEQLY